MYLWPHQTYALEEIPRLIAAGERRLCLTSPTGGGKTRILCELIQRAVAKGWYACVYTSRKLLVNQLSEVLSRYSIRYGIRAAGFADERELPVQISSLPTEGSRVLRSERWNVHGNGNGQRMLAIVDEAHLNKSNTAQAILGKHYDAGAVYLGLTATPIDLAHLYDRLIVAGTPSELRACGALVPAYHYGPDEPEMKRFKASVKTGEYSEGDVRKAIMTKCIFSRVLENYLELNPERLPTILFGPGVPESQWFAEQFEQHGIRAAHIDGDGVWVDGEYSRNVNRDEILNDVRQGRIKVLCNRFVLREGLDLPEVSHLVLATVMGSLQTYLQSVGRGLRKCDGKDSLTIQDHGGHWWRHGSVNMDRHWELTYTENFLAGRRKERLREKKIPEPIRCAKCGMIRAGGPSCPTCGYQSKRKSRVVIQADGTLHEHHGDIYRPRHVRMLDDTLELWTKTYFRAKNSRNLMTFRQAEGFFFDKYRYWPPRDLPLMPRNDMDWYRSVAEVPRELLS